MKQTQTESTKRIDESFFIDISEYKKVGYFKATTTRVTHRAICNNCNSEDCLIIPSIEKSEGFSLKKGLSKKMFK